MLSVADPSAAHGERAGAGADAGTGGAAGTDSLFCWDPTTFNLSNHQRRHGPDWRANRLAPDLSQL